MLVRDGEGHSNEDEGMAYFWDLKTATSQALLVGQTSATARRPGWNILPSFTPGPTPGASLLRSASYPMFSDSM